ncbi:MAG: signal peptidase I [Coriobacteriia bacterium]|nr:signal peptidase I [Coriobacteriia bacterium]
MTDHYEEPQSTDAEVIDEQEAEQPHRVSTARQIIEFIATLAVAFLIAQVVRTYVVQPFMFPTGSMIPTIQIGDQVLVNKFVYRFQQPARGDVVVLDDPTGEVPILIKRVIATGGETVNLVGGKVLVNGKPLSESYTHGLPSAPLPGSMVMFPLKVPAGYVWVMGDNRTSSKDARWFGPVPMDKVHGRAFLTYWPIPRFGALE